MCQEKVHHTGMVDEDREWDTWEEILYDIFIDKVNDYANYLMKDIIPRQDKLKKGRKKMLVHFKDISKGNDNEMKHV
jgi:hypothetical protein